MGPCAKQVVTCTLVHPDGRRWVGRNDVKNAVDVCPRGAMPSGQGYELCKSVCMQQGHAEEQALRAAGKDARGCTAYIEGIHYVCMSCQAILTDSGVRTFVLGSAPAPAQPAGAAASEPVAKVVETDIDISVIDAVLPVGTKLYVSAAPPQPAAQPVQGGEAVDERAKFEAKVRELSNGEPDFNSAAAMWAWAMWQARATLAPVAAQQAASKAPAAQNQAATGMSIDTEAFRKLIQTLGPTLRHLGSEYAEVVAHIDTHTADLRAQLARQGQGFAKLDLTDYSKPVTYSNRADSTACDGTGPKSYPLAPPAASSAQPADLRALYLIKELSRISMSLAADLVKGADYTFQGHDYLDRNFVCERVMQWRQEWDATTPVQDALVQQARASAQPDRGAAQAGHDYDDPTLACSSCGLTMGESRTLGHLKLGILTATPASTPEASQQEGE